MEENLATAQSGGGDDLRASIAAALDGQTGEPSQDKGPDASFKQYSGYEKLNLERADEPDTSGPTRDEKGRFAAKERAEEEAEPDAEPSEADTETEPDEQEQEQPKTEARPPASWSPREKELFKTLPSDAQAIIARREEEMTRGFTQKTQEFADAKRFFDEARSVIGPYMPMIQAEGGTPMGAIQQLLNTAYVLRTGTPEKKAALLSEIARQYGVDLSTADQSQEQEYVDPQFKALRDEQQRLNAIIAQQQEAQRQAQLHAQQQQRASVAGEIERFAKEHEHYAALEADMAPIVQALRMSDPAKPHSEVLKEAYERALWANPETRALELDRQRREAEAKRMETAKRKAADAAKSAGSVTGAPSGAPSVGPKASLRDEILAAMGG